MPRVDDRRVINGILWRFRTGSPWADVPERYGSYTTCYNRFVRWRKAGVWDHVLREIAKAFDGDIIMIDSSCVRVHQHAATGKRGMETMAAWDVPAAACTTKIHAGVDADGRPINLDLTAGQATTTGWQSRCCRTCAKARSSLLTAPTTPIPCETWPKKNGPGPMFRQNATVRLPFQRMGLPPTQSHRALLQQTQTVPRHRNQI